MVVLNNEELKGVTLGCWAESPGLVLSGDGYGKQQMLWNQTYLALNSESLCDLMQVS